MAEHLRDEITTLNPENFVNFSDKEQKESDEMLKSILKKRDPSWHLCSGIGRHTCDRLSVLSSPSASMPMDRVNTVMALPIPIRRILVPVSCHLLSVKCKLTGSFFSQENMMLRCDTAHIHR
jgi:hypothetical protein